MTDTIQLDLNDLTQAHLDEAKPICGEVGCLYSAPCIIGTLVPKYRRLELDSLMGASISTLEAEGRVEFPDAEQSRDAQAMQSAFDCGKWDDVLNIAGKYVK